jgi:hypothetical protein
MKRSNAISCRNRWNWQMHPSSRILKPVTGNAFQKENDMHGVENWFVPKQIFGETFDFQGELLDNMTVHPLGGSVFLEWIVSKKVLHAPERWHTFDEKVYISLDLFGVSDTDIHTVSANHMVYIPYVIRSVHTETVAEHLFRLVMESENGDRFCFVYQSARIQKVKPVKLNPLTKEYEVTA